MRRRGVTLLELLVALAILAAGGGAILDMLTGARGVLGSTQDMLRIQNQALQALDEAEVLVASGGLVDLGAEEEELLEAEEPGIRYAVTLRHADAPGLLELEVVATDGDRHLALTRRVAEPTVSFFAARGGAR